MNNRMRTYRDSRPMMDRGDYGDYGYDYGDYRDERRGGRRDRGEMPRMRDRRDYGNGYYEGEFRGYTDRGYDGMAQTRRYDTMMRDYASGMLSNKELRQWQDALCKEFDQTECDMFQFEDICKMGEDMGIHFDQMFSKEEFYTTVLMLYSDYRKTCGRDITLYLGMARDFLEDRDAKVKGGEKLAAYHDHIADV